MGKEEGRKEEGREKGREERREKGRWKREGRRGERAHYALTQQILTGHCPCPPCWALGTQ